MSFAPVQLIDLPYHGSAVGDLVALQSTDGVVPFSISRVFAVRAGPNVTRGHHAHKLCNQLMVCLYGRCNVFCADGISKQAFLLDRADKALLVPFGIWAEQHYLETDTVLIVLCDQPYEEQDYIRNYDDFLEFRKAIKSAP